VATLPLEIAVVAVAVVVVVVVVPCMRMLYNDCTFLGEEFRPRVSNFCRDRNILQCVFEGIEC
jgi:hypothetical protein